MIFYNIFRRCFCIPTAPIRAIAIDSFSRWQSRRGGKKEKKREAFRSVRRRNMVRKPIRDGVRFCLSLREWCSTRGERHPARLTRHEDNRTTDDERRCSRSSASSGVSRANGPRAAFPGIDRQTGGKRI